MKTISHQPSTINLLALLLLLAISHQPSAISQTLPSTPFTRTFLRVTNAETARTALDIVSTNASTVTNPWDQDIDGAGYVLTNLGSLTATGAVTAGSFSGSAANLTNVFDGHAIILTKSGQRTVFQGVNALSNAVAAHVAGDVITVYGTNIVTSSLVLTNATLRGGGNAVIVYEAAINAGVCVVPYNNSTVESLDIYCYDYWAYGLTTNTTQLLGTDNQDGLPAITNAVIRNVRLYGNQDAWYIRHTNSSTAQLEMCQIRSGGDAGAIVGPCVLQYNLCFISAPGTPSYQRVFVLGAPGNCTNIFNQCTFYLETGTNLLRGITWGTSTTNTATIINGGLFRNYNTNASIIMVGPESGSASAALVTINGTRFENYGAADCVATGTSAAAHEFTVINADVFSDTTATRQFLSSSKGLLKVWGGNADASQFTSAISGGASNLFLRATNTAPADTGTADAWINLYIGSTLYKVPLYTP